MLTKVLDAHKGIALRIDPATGEMIMVTFDPASGAITGTI